MKTTKTIIPNTNLFFSLSLKAFFAAAFIGLFNLTLYSTLRYHLPLLFTEDAEVVELVAKVLPLVAVMQVFDCTSAGAHGLLRGVGKQSIGGPANLIAYYVISMPISLGLSFGLGWKLEGLWTGVTVGLILYVFFPLLPRSKGQIEQQKGKERTLTDKDFSRVSLIEYIYIFNLNWDNAAREAETRNAAG